MEVHMENAGKLVMGKAVNPIPEREQYSGLLGKVEKSISYTNRLISGLVEKTLSARAHMEHFQLSADRKRKKIPEVSAIREELRQSSIQDLWKSNVWNEAR